jgi:DNA-binding IscR family transcriptional regulator
MTSLRRHPGYVCPSATRVFSAVAAGAHTYTDLAAATGLAHGTIQQHLDTLRRAGLVDWQPGCHGTMHAVVGPVALTIETPQ